MAHREKTVRINEFWNIEAEAYLRENFGLLPLVILVIGLTDRFNNMPLNTPVEYAPSEHKVMYRAVKLGLITKNDLIIWLRAKANSAIKDITSLPLAEKNLLFFGTSNIRLTPLAADAATARMTATRQTTPRR